ncbi:MAG: 50S ribosomal protein L27 [bacterium]
MAHKKAGGSTQLGRDSESKRLGVKVYGGQQARAGQIIIRQRGSRYQAGPGVRIGCDDTLYAAIEGIVKFSRQKIRNFAGSLKQKTVVSVK